jgi:hypothetical protein
MITLEQWICIGIQAGFCGPPVCATHDGMPMSDAEYEDEDDACVSVLRIYDTSEVKRDVEKDHPPSVWRATNMGLKLIGP